jgi:hypothetical protein
MNFRVEQPSGSGSGLLPSRGLVGTSLISIILQGTLRSYWIKVRGVIVSVGVFVDTDKIAGLQLFRRDETDERKEDCLAGGCFYNRSFALAH